MSEYSKALLLKALHDFNRRLTGYEEERNALLNQLANLDRLLQQNLESISKIEQELRELDA